jgi:hypothetical protein
MRLTSSVCIKLGLIASFIKIASDPVAPISSQVIGSPDLESPITILPNLRCISGKSLERASTAIHSEATAISKPVERVLPVSVAA